MTGRSYNCLTCGVSLGRGKAYARLHKTPEDCILVLESEVALIKNKARVLENHLTTLRRIEDAGGVGRYPMRPYV